MTSSMKENEYNSVFADGITPMSRFCGGIATQKAVILTVNCYGVAQRSPVLPSTDLKGDHDLKDLVTSHVALIVSARWCPSS